MNKIPKLSDGLWKPLLRCLLRAYNSGITRARRGEARRENVHEFAEACLDDCKPGCATLSVSTVIAIKDGAVVEY